MSENTKKNLFTFWELTHEILNALLFVLIGFVILAIDLTPKYIFVGLISIPICLFVRYLSVGLPIDMLKLCKRKYTNGIVGIMTWGGLRGGISIALALSLPKGETRDLFLTITYVIVAWSILIQGSTIKKLIRKSIK